jgi:hypothetical protein
MDNIVEKPILLIPKTLIIAIAIELFSINSVIFLNKKENKILTGTFSNIIYSTNDTIFNGIYLKLRNIFGKINQDDIRELMKIEQSILKFYKKFYDIQKNTAYVIQECFCDFIYKAQKSLMKPIKSEKSSLIFKISGIWETDEQIGITLSSSLS